MSWSGFKKSMNRTGITLMQGFGAIDKTVDKDFLEREASFKTLQAKAEDLHRQSRGYLDSVRSMVQSQVAVAAHLETFYDPQSPEGKANAEYHQAMLDIESQTLQEFEEAYCETLLNPLGRYCGYIPEFNAAISKRSRKVLDYDQARSKLKKLSDKTMEDEPRVMQEEQAAEQAQKTYEVLNQQLIDEIPQFINIRIPYMEPSLEAFLKTQLKFYDDTYAKLQNVGGKLPAGAQTDALMGANQGVDNEVENVLEQMRTLSICGMSVR
ncbi:BAR adaptor protein Hob3 [Dispira simplex]|nr:BAR adaptor protein Hob3 [Dispira simplex]